MDKPWREWWDLHGDEAIDRELKSRIVLQHRWKIWRFRICIYENPMWKISWGTLDLGRLRLRYTDRKWCPLDEDKTLAIRNGGKLWDICRLKYETT